MARTTDFSTWLAKFAADFDKQLNVVLGDELSHDSRLHQAVKYALLGKGKRIRPALCCLVASNGAPNEAVMRTAMAIEAVHTYSLVHDDLPAMDDDCLRRGRATVHVQFDEATAILCGDALLTYAFELLATVDVDAEQRIELVRVLSQSAGHNGMVLGQHLDIDATSQSISFEELQNIHLLKTTELIASAIEMGSVLAGQNTDKWRKFGEKIGMLFQVVDDILDVTADSEQLGKTAGKDDAAQKPTAVSVLGLDEAREFAAQLCATAENGLQQLGVESTNPLNQLPSFLLDRSF
ncbi:MAG: polyprenyl synthetase family protein [Planctomycetota bacterium]|nr:polyprenyl synthetase family protein [Planctomycetota bacterium]